MTTLANLYQGSPCADLAVDVPKPGHAAVVALVPSTSKGFPAPIQKILIIVPFSDCHDFLVKGSNIPKRELHWIFQLPLVVDLWLISHHAEDSGLYPWGTAKQPLKQTFRTCSGLDP